MKKQIIVGVGISLVLMTMISSSPSNPSTSIKHGESPIQAIDEPLVYGTIGLVRDLDPHYAWGSASIDHINQVAEGLFAYDLGSNTGGIIPRLAAGCGTWNENATELTVPLRENVTFHDGTAFNASAVKWNFDRLNGFIDRRETQIVELYKPLAGVYPDTPLLINETIVTNEFEVKFVLNYPFAAFVPLLCFSGSAMISPASANVSEFLEAGTDLLVGTGPYVHVSTTTEKTVFEAYPEYYRGIPAVQHMEWIAYEDSTTASNALLDGTIDIGDISSDFLDEFEASPNITVGQLRKSPVIFYMRMNNDIVTKPIRQAISYAIDYDYMLSDLRDGNAVRMISPVPEGIAFHNPNVRPAIYNVTHARQIVIDAGLSHGLTIDSSDQEWLDMTDNDPIASHSYYYNYGNIFREDLGILVKGNCKAVGIKIDSVGYEWSNLAFNPSLIYSFDLYMIGWGPDYNDPSSYINPLFSNTSLSNGANVNDPWLQTTMMEAMADTNQTSRKAKYFAIQEYIVEDLMPWVFLYVPVYRDVFADTITNWNLNPMRQMDFFSASFQGEDTIFTDQLNVSCGFEAPWDYYIPPEPPLIVTPPSNRDYALLGFLGLVFCSGAVLSMPFKHTKRLRFLTRRDLKKTDPTEIMKKEEGINEEEYGFSYDSIIFGKNLSDEFFVEEDKEVEKDFSQ